MSDLFGNDSLFIDFDKHPNNASSTNKNETIDLTEDSDKDVPHEANSSSTEKSQSVITLQSGKVVEDRLPLKMPSDWPLVSSLAAFGDRPNYSSTFRDPLTIPEPVDDKPPQHRPSRPKLACFNCGGPHLLSACKESKDYGKIAQKRREYNEANPQVNRPAPSPQQQSNSPYPNGDLIPSASQVPPLVSFDHFKPGNISHVLRQAMGLFPNQIPPYVYFLREYGYPPGWLEEARVPLEPTEISDVPLFDPKRVVEYPGYNVEHPPETVDETRHFHVRRLDSRHSAQEMRRWMEALQKHHLQRRSLLASRKSESSSSTAKPAVSQTGIGGGEAAMDLDDTSGDEAAIFTPAFDATKVASHASISSNENSNSSTEAADIESLEQEREKLLRLLESTLSGNVTAPQTTEEGEEETGHMEEPTVVAQSEEGQQVTPAAVTMATPKPSMSQSLGVSSGTPLPVSATDTPVSVPDREKFASGIGCHLPYQNLPEAVGTFERLKHVLAGIRKRSTGAHAGISASVPASPLEQQPGSSSSSSRNADGTSRSRHGYVDYDSPPEDDGNFGGTKRNNRGSGDSNRKDHREGRRSSSSDHHRGYYSEPRSSSHRYRPY